MDKGLFSCGIFIDLKKAFDTVDHQILLRKLKVTGHPFLRFAENRYCALNISPIFIKFSPNVLQCMQNMIKL
jgi:hypothetical protein